MPDLGGDIQPIAFSKEPGPIGTIPVDRGEPLEPASMSPARGPPTAWGELVQVHDDRETGARDSGAAHLLGDACGSAIGRATLCLQDAAPNKSSGAKNTSRRTTCVILRLHATPCETGRSSPSRNVPDRGFAER